MLTNNKKNSAGVAAFIIITLLVLPVLSLAAGLVPCGDNPTVDASGKVTGACTFNDFITMINNIINWIISIAGVIFTISCVYGGFLWIMSGESPEKKTRAQTILWRTLLGFVIILTSWLIVYTILNTLAPGNTSILKFIK